MFSDVLKSLSGTELKTFIQEVLFYQITSIHSILPPKGKLYLKEKYEIIPLSENGKETASGVVFDSDFLSSSVTLSDDNRKIKKHGASNFDCAALGTQCQEYTIRLISDCSYLMMGFARSISVNSSNYATNGYYLYAGTGGLYSMGGISNVPYSTPSLYTNGTIVKVKLEDGNISYTVNGKDYGVAFKNVNDYLDLYPAFDLYHQNCEFEFCDDQ